MAEEEVGRDWRRGRLRKRATLRDELRVTSGVKAELPSAHCPVTKLGTLTKMPGTWFKS